MKLKQYKLKRDLPTFKTGDEFIVCCGNLIEVKPDGTLGVCAYSGTTLKKFPNILTDWFEEVKEPLIKDAGARDVMRMWAKVNRIPTNATTIEYHFVESLCGTESEFWDNNLHIMFYGKIAPNAIHGKIYTIDELCGEEEE